MATYKGIKGYNIASLASDPSPLQTGQVWYNTTSATMKAYGTSVPAGAWASGTAFNTGRANLGVAGTTTAAVIFGGDTGGPARDECETWNGSTWTAAVALPQGVFMATGLGTSTAAVSVGGSPAPVNGVLCNKWDGTSWSSTGAINTAAGGMGAAGIQTAGMKFGGSKAASPYYNDETEEFDGTSWSEKNDLNVARRAAAAATKGTTTSTLYAGGEPGYTDISETWDGTCWTEGNDLNTGRSAFSGCGIVTSAIGMGGNVPPKTAATEVYDGTSWSEVADLGTATMNNAAIGSNATEALSCGGTPTPPVYTNAVEVWSAGDATQTFTAS